jgi:hypothetical protein
LESHKSYVALIPLVEWCLSYESHSKSCVVNKIDNTTDLNT